MAEWTEFMRHPKKYKRVASEAYNCLMQCRTNSLQPTSLLSSLLSLHGSFDVSAVSALQQRHNMRNERKSDTTRNKRLKNQVLVTWEATVWHWLFLAIISLIEAARVHATLFGFNADRSITPLGNVDRFLLFFNVQMC